MKVGDAAAASQLPADDDALGLRHPIENKVALRVPGY